MIPEIQDQSQEHKERFNGSRCQRLRMESTLLYTYFIS